MSTTYPVLVPSASWYSIGEHDGYHYANVILFRSADDKTGTSVATCGHRHRLARSATACAERMAKARIRANLRHGFTTARLVGS